MVVSRLATRSSCKPMRTNAYSGDIRWRMVLQCEVQGLTLGVSIPWNLSVDVSTVHRTVNKFKKTGSVSKKYSVANRHQLQKLTKCVQLTVLHLILQRPSMPSIYLWELQQEIYSRFELEISIPSLCNFLKKE